MNKIKLSITHLSLIKTIKISLVGTLIYKWGICFFRAVLLLCVAFISCRCWEWFSWSIFWEWHFIFLSYQTLLNLILKRIRIILNITIPRTIFSFIKLDEFIIFLFTFGAFSFPHIFRRIFIKGTGFSCIYLWVERATVELFISFLGVFCFDFLVFTF
jgi:hypothetical protein